MSELVKIQIENSYTDGHESTVLADVEPPLSLSDEDMEDWWDDVAYPETGDGHYIEVFNATGDRLGSCYTVTVIEAPLPELVGQTREWID